MPDPLRWSDGTKWVAKPSTLHESSYDRAKREFVECYDRVADRYQLRPLSGLRPPTPSDLTPEDRALLAGCGIVWP